LLLAENDTFIPAFLDLQLYVIKRIFFLTQF
jgi:hypothetical protein